MDLSRLLRALVYGLVLSFAGVSVAAPAHARTAPGRTRDPRPFTKPYHDGFVLVLWSEHTDAEVNVLLDRIRFTGSDSLELPLFGCQSTIHSSDVGDCEPSNRPFVLRVAHAAVAKGFSVTLLPIVITPQWDWRGLFDPTDVAAWFKTYTAWMDGVAQDAIDIGSSELIAATEFKALYKYTNEWKAFLSHLRGVFPGPIVATANWDEMNYSFWDQVDAIGVSAYFPLSTLPAPAQDVLDRAWLAHRAKLLELSDHWKRPLHFTEVGYTSSTAAAATPWTYGDKDAPDAALQARCFEAFRKAWTGQKALVRASVWATSDPSDPNLEMSFDPIGKPAEGVLRQLFAERPSARLAP